MKYTVYFEVENYFDGDTRVECGFITCDTLAEAVERLEDYFGNELLAIARLELLDTSLICMTKEVAKEVLNYNF